MLQFLFGRPAGGKTTAVLSRLHALAAAGKESVLLIPEQFSFESERAVLKTLGDQNAQRVAVMSFTRLCDEVARQAGGMAGRVLSQADKVIFMSRALRSISSELTLWGRYCRSVSFAKTMLDAVGELKINALTPEDLKKAALLAEDPALQNKLHDLTLIYEAYDMLVGEKFIDPADSLTKLYRRLEHCPYFEGKTVFLDSFKGFTGQQYAIIERIMSQADDVFVSLTNDPALDREYNVYHNIRTAVERIKNAAGRYGQAVAEPIVLKDSHVAAPSLSALERLLAGENPDRPPEDGAITLCAAAGLYDEAEFAARTIRRLVRTEGYRYRDFVLIARDAEPYEEAVTLSLSQNGIPVFCDKRLPLSAFPLSSAVLAAVQAAITPSTENILRFHKTGLGTLTYDEIATLENYTTLWHIDGELWHREWDMDPRGFVSEPEEERQQAEALTAINALRQKALSVFTDFEMAFSGTAADMAAAVVELLEHCGVAEKLADMSLRFEEEYPEFSQDVFRQAYAKWMQLFDSMARCYGDKNLSKSEFLEALTLSVSFETVGTTPRMLDEVTFGAADRIRPSRPKVAFLLGANQGIFPKTVSPTGILAGNERKKLIALGLDLPDDSMTAVINEQYLVYGNLCCASDKLFLSYSRHDVTGAALEPAAFVSEIVEQLPCRLVFEPSETLEPETLPETVPSAYARYCRTLGQNAPDASALRAALVTTDARVKIEALTNNLGEIRPALSRSAAERLFGQEIRMSASRFDRYHRCPFSFFCLYGLKAKKLRPAEFDVLQRGTIAHYVLERLVNEHKQTMTRLTREQADALVDEYITDYLDGIAGYRSTAGARAAFLVSCIARSLKDVVWHMIEEFAQSDFEPMACEMKIGPGGDLPTLIFPFEDGRIALTGSIDRVDAYHGYIRVIDYKTGSKKFKLPDILFGLNLQMLIYLYAAVRAAGLPDEKAAGILYMPAKRDKAENGLSMNGLVRADENLVAAMDKEKSGKFIPRYALTKSGNLDKRCTSFIESERFSEIFDLIERLMSDTGRRIAGGDIGVTPMDGRESAACQYCDYKSICGREDKPNNKVPPLSLDETFDRMKGGEPDAL